ncbi:MAG: molecular chaperone DnaJ [Alphaproteobacteria bacterium]|nr:molecular chaperone DnaJ [Alphaproteobacteria bacterium]
MSKRDFYEILGVQRRATADELKAAYRKKAKELHPDRNPGDKTSEQNFKELNEAYDILKDDQKRAAYDQYGHQAFEGPGGGRGGGPGGGFDFSTSFTDVFDDLFGEFMGTRRGGGAQRASRGSDLRYNMEISLDDAYAGKTATIRIPGSVACEACSGSGAEAGSKPQACPTCSGVGKVRAQQGFFTIERTCPTCQGLGRVVKNPCRSCSGSGRVQRERTLNVNIPQGVEDGTRIRLAGEGEAGLRGGPKGDLYIFLSIATHPLFKRDNADLHCSVPVSFSTVALGGNVEVPTLGGGRVRVAIPEGTQSGKEFRVRGKGMPGLRGQGPHGDLIVEVLVETPVNLTKKQQDFLREFEKAGGAQNSPKTTSFFAKVKEFFGEQKD